MLAKVTRYIILLLLWYVTKILDVTILSCRLTSHLKQLLIIFGIVKSLYYGNLHDLNFQHISTHVAIFKLATLGVPYLI